MIAGSTWILMSSKGHLSQQGRCLTFDQSADGLVKSDGVANLVLTLEKEQARPFCAHGLPFPLLVVDKSPAPPGSVETLVKGVCSFQWKRQTLLWVGASPKTFITKRGTVFSSMAAAGQLSLHKLSSAHRGSMGDLQAAHGFEAIPAFDFWVPSSGERQHGMRGKNNNNFLIFMCKTMFLAKQLRVLAPSIPSAHPMFDPE